MALRQDGCARHVSHLNGPMTAEIDNTRLKKFFFVAMSRTLRGCRLPHEGAEVKATIKRRKP